MLGVARAAQYAGWWMTDGNRVGTIVDNTVTQSEINNNLLIRPSYYANYNGVSTSTSGTSCTTSVTSGSSAFDMTSVGTTNKKQISSITTRFGSDYLSSASSGFDTGYTYFELFTNNGTQVYRGTNFYKSSVNYAFSISQGGDIAITHTNFDNNFRNRWLTYIAATSDNPVTDFAGWTGGATDPQGNGWGTRSYLVDPVTGTVLLTADGWNYGSAGTIDLTQTWTMGAGSSSYNLNPYIATTDISLFDRDQLEIISYWYSIGNTLDPSVYWPNLTGTGIAGSVAGVQSWLNWTAGTAGTLLTNGSSIDYGYSIPAGGTLRGSRAPDNTVVEIVAQTNATSAQTIPTFTSL